MSTKLSEHFSLAEFACRHCGVAKAHPELVAGLERLRAVGYAASGLPIMSGYRCPLHNAAVGGASLSQHRNGAAADVPLAVELDDVRALVAFSGIGWQWVGRFGKRRRLVRHVDVRHAVPEHNVTGGTLRRPTIWSY